MRRAPSTPPVIPGFDYVRLLGAGGFSDVFLYEQKLPKRRVAVKVLLTDELNSASRDAFVGEANLMAQLSAHPYIVTIFHADVASDDRPYFVMEYCSGPSLGERYKRETFGVADALRTGVRLSSAIATAHAAGILHRDIKPANVLTNDFGWPALTDFGISSALEDELPVHTVTGGGLRDTGGSTESQSVGMSVPWSPPEMFGDAPRPDVRSDVFSLAATIHTLLAGRTPFEIPGRSNGALDLIGRIERGVITPIGRDDVPRSLTAVLQKGMATRRSERYATAIEFARALQRVELELGYAPTTIEVPNLVQLEEVPESSAEGGDETRVRSVSTINAQPAAPAVAAGPNSDETKLRPITVIPPTAAGAVAPPETASRGIPLPIIGTPPTLEEGTVLRGAPPVDERTVQRASRSTVDPQAGTPAPPALPATAATATEPAEPVQRKKKLPAIIAVAALVVVVGGAAIGVAVSGGTNARVEATTTKPTPESAIGGGSVPTPQLLAATPSGNNKSVTFSWKNPDPIDGDVFRWALAESPDEKKPLKEAKVTVKRPSSGARVCIEVTMIRAGRASAPLKSCNPA